MAPVPQAPLRHEIARTRLIDTLDRRFDVPITTIVAGPGFGKSTLLAQAVRRNQTAPRGLDVWVSCEPGDESADRLASVLLRAIGQVHLDHAEHTSSLGLDRVLHALRSTSPLDVCVVLDDCHELPKACSSTTLLTNLIRQLPANVHLVVCGRSLPELPIARLRAADAVVEITEQDLAFTHDEAAQIATLHGRTDASIADLGGWPSLVRLALDAPDGATRLFVWEEVVSRLDHHHRRQLLALATLGWADGVTLTDVSGEVTSVDGLARAVPLVTVADGIARAHHLWSEMAPRLFTPEEVADVRAKAFDHLLRSGQIVRAGSLASSWRDATMVSRTAMSLVRSTLGALPADTAQRWLEAVADEEPMSGELQLLRLASDQAIDFNDASLDERADTITERLAEEGNFTGEMAAIAVAAVCAHARGDLPRLFRIASRAGALGKDISDEPLLALLVGSVQAALAELSGDVEAALSRIHEIDDVKRTAIGGELLDRMHVQLLVLSGRGDEAVAVAEARLSTSRSAHVRGTVDYVRWMAGDPAPYRGRSFRPHDPRANSRDVFHHAAYSSVIGASVGNKLQLAECRRLATPFLSQTADPRDSATISAFTALLHVVDHDEAAAAAAIEAHLERHEPTARPGEVHLRRYFAVVYVCSPAMRAHWDANSQGMGPEFGPTLVRARAIADLLLRARAGELSRKSELPDPAHVLTTLPLCWSVELAARAHAAGHVGAHALLENLAEWAPEAVHDELRWCSLHGDAAAQRGARAMLATVPQKPVEMLRIEVLGPTRLLVGGREVERPELRRARVRELLALLIVERTVSRERAMDLLWADTDAETAARNLRVTLSRLRQLLEPDRPPGEATYYLRVDGTAMRLARVPGLEVDYWQLAYRLEAHAEPTTDTERLEWVLGAWRDTPLQDLARFIDLIPVMDRVRADLHDAVARLGEIYIAEGRALHAARCAERLLSSDPHDERAHRLALAAHLAGRDDASIRETLARLERSLAGMGVEPEATTRILMRQATARMAAAVSQV